MDILNLAVGVGVVVIIIGINNASTCARPQTAKLTIRAARSMFPNIWGGIRSCSDRPWRACGWDDLGDRPFFIGQWLLRTKMDAPRMESALPVTFWRFADGTTRQSPKAFPCVQEQYDALARSVEGFFVNPHESSYTVLKKALAGDNRAWDTLFSCLWPVAAGVAASVINGKGSKAMRRTLPRTFSSGSRKTIRDDYGCSIPTKECWKPMSQK